jgi:hypothetical protein
MKPKISKTTDLQIRGIPIATRDKLRRKAKSRGVSMSKYLIDLIDREVVERMPLDEWIAMVRKNPPVDLGDMSAADLIHEERAERDAHWDELWGLNKPKK